MPLPNNALVLVLDGRKMLFFRNHGDEQQIDLRTEAHDERTELKDRELRRDAQGAKGSSWHGATDTTGETDFHQLDEDSWAKQAAEQVNARALRGEFGALAIIAPPKTLGEIRKGLHKEAASRVIVEIDKEMTARPIPDIEALLVARTAPEPPATT